MKNKIVFDDEYIKSRMESLLSHLGGIRMKKRIVFDFDVVIHSYKSGWTKFNDIPDEPVPGIKELFQKLIDSNYIITISSSRMDNSVGTVTIAEWLEKHDIPYDELIYTKPSAFAYVGDRVIYFDGNTFYRNTEGLFEKIVNFENWINKRKSLQTFVGQCGWDLAPLSDKNTKGNFDERVRFPEPIEKGIES